MKKRQSIEETALYCPPMAMHENIVIETQLFEINTYAFHMHYHETLEVGICLSGEGVLYTETQKFNFSAADIQIVFPFVKHISIAKPGIKNRWYFTALRLPELLQHINCALPSELYHMIHHDGGISGIFSCKDYPELTACVNNIISESLEKKQDFEKICALSAMELLYQLRRIPGTDKQNTSDISGHDDAYQKIQPALLYLAEHISVAVSSEQLAALCFMSQTNFRILFKKVTGISPKQYIRKLVMSQCENYLLNTNLQIEEISRRFGFSDTSGLYRFFVQIHGISPAAYRTKARKMR
ncbi:MAG: AraC family transcriptional regulator [Ruminococcaceae bacterium]|nr:AraC family transcriptional regulator [Oscillospiraceae bacterium]